MKTKITLFFAILFAFSTFGFSQTVKVTSKKVTYNRPETTENEYKRKFTLERPIVSGTTGKKIETILSYEKNFEINIKEEQTEISWLDAASFETIYNKNGILNVRLSVEGSGAYPSTYSKSVVIDTKLGTKITPQAVFTNIPGLVAKVSKMQKTEMKKANEDYKKDPDSADFDASTYFTSAKYTSKDLDDFSISDEGITLRYNYDFPHVALALQPLGEYLFTWKELKPFIKKGSVFGQFAK